MVDRRGATAKPILWISWIAAMALWAGCSGSTEELPADPGTSGTGGTQGADASPDSTAGTGGTGGTGGTQTPPDAATDTSTIDGQPGEAGGGPSDSSPPDSSTDAACLVFHEVCDPNGDSCCAPLTCLAGQDPPRCGLEQVDAGLDGALCALPQQECTQQSCCPGLDCVPMGPTEICRPAMPDGGFPDAGTCNDLYAACGPGVGPCCTGLECKKQPPAFPDRTCLPPDPPDPSQCPPAEPQNGGACTVLGLQCSYGGMTVCTCFVSGWQCAY